MDKWEYKLVRLETESADLTAANVLGAEGWRVAGVLAGERVQRVLMERKVQPAAATSISGSAFKDAQP